MRNTYTLILLAWLSVHGCAEPQHRADDAGSRRRPPPAMTAETAELSSSLLRVHFINVGQGDCTLVQCPGGGTILVDCGSLGGADVDSVRGYVLARLGTAGPRIDTVVVTHPDKDHYVLIEDVLDGVSIGQIVLTGTPEEYPENNFDDWLNAREPISHRLHSEDFDRFDEEPKFLTCGNAKVRVLAADTAATFSPTNARSIVLLIAFGDTYILLTGDATFDTENVILSRFSADRLECEILKIGHHGSSTTSTSDVWAQTISPESAVVSAGYTNTFGHPRKEMVNRLAAFTREDPSHPMRWGWWEDHHAKFEDLPDYKESIYSTATNGNVVVTSNGTSYSITYDNLP